MKKTTVGAIVVTVLWLAGVAVLSYLKWDSFLAMKPNEMGDFFAGSVASPLALIWLVAGYMQQGEDLRLNTEALKLQQQELKEQVKATLQVAAHAEQQATASLAMVKLSKAERKERRRAEIAASQPEFIFDQFDVTGNNNFLFSIENIGEPARGIEISSGAFDECSYNFPPELIKGQKETVVFGEYISGAHLLDFIIDVEYTDIKGNLRAQRYNMKNGYSYLIDSWDENEILRELENTN